MPSIPKVVLVSHDRELLQLMSFALLRAGILPIPAYTSAQALRQVSEHAPALVILDWPARQLLMPIRAMRRVKVLSLADAPEADVVLHKPFGVEKLLTHVRACLARVPRPSRFEPHVRTA